MWVTFYMSLEARLSDGRGVCWGEMRHWNSVPLALGTCQKGRNYHGVSTTSGQNGAIIRWKRSGER